MKIALARQRRGPFNSKNVISLSSQNIVKHTVIYQLRCDGNVIHG